MPIFLRSLTCAGALIKASSCALAQLSIPNQSSAQVAASMRVQANSGNIQAWLESKDPRLVAWGAYFARENNDTTALEVAAQLVEKSLYQGGPDLLSGSGPQRAALSEVLDALIEKNVLLSANMLAYLYRLHPVQTIILLSRLPPDKRIGNLQQWYGGGLSEGSLGLARVAAMLLSKSPPAGFASSILSDSQERLVLHITVPVEGGKIGFMSGGTSGGLCTDYWPPNSLANWPELFYYRLHENDRTSADPLLVEAGGDEISWERVSGDKFRSCGEVEGLTPETRHHLLAEMLGERDQDMSWRTQKDVTIEKETDDQVKREIGAAILAEHEMLLKCVQDFLSKSLITSEEAMRVVPKLSVQIKYEGSLNRP